MKKQKFREKKDMTFWKLKALNHQHNQHLVFSKQPTTNILKYVNIKVIQQINSMFCVWYVCINPSTLYESDSYSR